MATVGDVGLWYFKALGVGAWGFGLEIGVGLMVPFGRVMRCF